MLENVHKMKIAMIGESGVGKTCLISRYVDDKFENFEPTKAASFKSKTLISSNKKVYIRQMIWDTAGQEAFRSLASFYYKDADAAVLVYDVTNKKSFNELSYWVGELIEYGPKNIILVVAGNKSDMVDKEVVDANEASDFAKSHGASFYLVSAKSNINVAEMYLEIGMKKFPQFKDEFDEYQGNPNDMPMGEAAGEQKKGGQKLRGKNGAGQRGKGGCC
eukprot:TRINITY_DN9040_c0_g3_i1.p1 TRINITY_DN9040_c0_g3~~TRINITY_DN9040_c0_g3_i1.p1  ORF type:complete len:219 (-),score=64.02 TRINITY_DN9040_c0_g3_i1:128-784(-)